MPRVSRGGALLFPLTSFNIRTSLMKIMKHAPGQVPNLELVGNIDESSDFSQIEIDGQELHVDCYEVARINSVGVRKWIIFFNSMRERGVKVFYYRISTALVDQFNYIKNFGAGGQVISASAPFSCQSCKKMVLVEKFKKEIASTDFERELFNCPLCQKKGLRFDDVAEDYFFFWKA
jgi:anti-anti-sigma regulatory factor